MTQTSDRDITAQTQAAPVTVLWDPAVATYNFGDHPLDPVRVELTMALARDLGVLDRPNVSVMAAPPADRDTLRLVHQDAYLHAVQAAPHDPFFRGWGLNTSDNPLFDGMHEAASLITGMSVRAAEAVWRGEALHAVNVSGGLHHAMPDRASGFCVYNDPAIAIARMLELGAERVAYVDIDVHHGDGVQAVFWNDPRVLTVSLHESPVSLFPGTGFPTEIGGADAEGAAVNVALPAGTGDAGWLRAFHAVVPSVVRAFRPQVLVSQCGCDSHFRDPLANLTLSVEGQRAAQLEMRRLAHELTGGRWVVFGGGGYGLVDVVPRTWSHLLATATGEPMSTASATPNTWRGFASSKRPAAKVPTVMGDGADASFQPWDPGSRTDPVDRAILATRRAVFPLHGLDPDDPRD
ncbi:acetoin utilization protein AcuC [Cryptosporangium arvum]|uniref:acetoin utilization protein AcuC n=1 Tax=Cryptosporangium arvum TaxID=80871 RepID=UPI0004B180FE|nr:acetoin utilization protein AcuC [Cryptosporangium arvum]